MSYTKDDLKGKLLQMYPEISESDVDLGLTFDEGKDAWVVKLRRDGHELNAFLDRKDADECMEGTKCVYLGIKIGEFVSNFEEV